MPLLRPLIVALYALLLSLSGTSALAHLPAELLARLRQAVIVCDMENIRQAINEIRPSQPAAADLLLELASNFEYQKILGALSAGVA